MTPEDAERSLTEWAAVAGDRDNRIHAAITAGLSKYRIQQLTGLARSTIDRILRQPPPEGHPPR